MPRHVRITLLALAVAGTYAMLWPRLAASRLPGNHQGYAPEQPIAYSHRLHAGELGIDCQYCHTGAATGRHAGIPSADVCMNCHQFVQSSWVSVMAEQNQAKEEGRKPRRIVSPQLRKLYRAFGLNDELQPDDKITPEPIRWKQVHRLPDFTFFDHSVHVHAGLACQKCHGPVETMERVRQFETLSMGWCVNCHREENAKELTGAGGRPLHASTSCAACHY